MKEMIIKAIGQSKNNYISYSTFMELALYDPNNGYYMKGQVKIGKKGDFYTSSSVSPVFAEIIGKVLIRQIEKEIVPPTIIEFGGGNGSFAREILKTWHELSPTTFRQGHYIIVETSPYHRELIVQELKEFKNVQIVCSFEELKNQLPTYKGIVFSNEFFDAFPIHIIQRKNGELVEVMITEINGELVELDVPLSNEEIKKYVMDYQIMLAEGQRYEIPLAMSSFFLNLGSWMESGLVMTIDYGYTDEEWGLPYHKEGSLRGFYQHQLINNPLQYVGEMDLTTHIHFDKLVKDGKTCGFNEYELLRQDEFLIRSGILQFLQEHTNTDPFSESSKKNRAIRSLIMQGGISSAFRVLIQSKGFPLNLEIK